MLTGQEAKKVFDDAQNMLNKTIQGKKLKATATIAFYPANSVGDDIEVYDENGTRLATLFGLRQQVKVICIDNYYGFCFSNVGYC